MSRRVETEPDILTSDKPLLRQEALTPEVCTGAASCYRPTHKPGLARAWPHGNLDRGLFS